MYSDAISYGKDDSLDSRDSAAVSDGTRVPAGREGGHIAQGPGPDIDRKLPEPWAESDVEAISGRIMQLIGYLRNQAAT